VGYGLFISHYKQRKQVIVQSPISMSTALLSTFLLSYPTHEPGNVWKFVYKVPNFIWLVP